MKYIGIITYHAPYNFGSTLQAYATQKAVEDLGYDAKIINYRMRPQKDAYSLVRIHEGSKVFIKDAIQFPVFSLKKIRAKNFENFFIEYLKLTPEFADPDDFHQYANQFDVIISGSDQIWNKHSNELEHSDWSFMAPYLLKGYSGKKISYASSVSNSSDDDIQHMIPDLLEFSHISMRERGAADRLSSFLKREVDTVLDPTLLYNGENWRKFLNIKRKKPSQPYILFYSLAPVKPLRRGSVLLKQLADKGYQIRYITPYFQYPYMDKRFRNCLSYGPIEFLTSLYNASGIVTDSFHGTMFSINFNKPFWSINNACDSDIRKTTVLEKYGLMSRSITWDSRISALDMSAIDYDNVNQLIDADRKESIGYLKKAIES